ncbi:hypothetical protein H6F50_21450 [Coleofasciculus sp. FACHB-712]|nr:MULTISPECIES: hypothetical protein [unclassified Coleofasciculus]MBD1892191.1 hypothetical protein [Coleofasciculus sp. FACHB-SPT9]MBD1893384.1 hypothetical protein [Coleofasciculus sp. FACHB-129]MBD1944891.1 hypothetical protein [Coleofasciculus sp. FACHB-712]
MPEGAIALLFLHFADIREQFPSQAWHIWDTDNDPLPDGEASLMSAIAFEAAMPRPI